MARAPALVPILVWLLVVRTSIAWPVISFSSLWTSTSNAVPDNNNDNGTVLGQQEGKALNFFPVPVSEECLSDDGRRKGICLNTYECRIQDGVSHGACALGFGVCCVFTASCGKEVINNVTYFVNPDFPGLSTAATECTVKVKKIAPEISQLRLDFVHFNLGQPNRRTGVCEVDAFIMSGGSSKELRLCGQNHGQHIYYDVENVNEPITITMNLTRENLNRMWEVKISQIEFQQRAPAGCMQYYREPKGVIKTMNYADNGRHLADQDYGICMRQAAAMCSIVYEPCDDNSFKLGPSKRGPTKLSSSRPRPGINTANLRPMPRPVRRTAMSHRQGEVDDGGSGDLPLADPVDEGIGGEDPAGAGGGAADTGVADVGGPGLGGADFGGPGLGGADFGGPGLGGADFGGPGLGGADFGVPGLGGADFGGADLGGVGINGGLPGGIGADSIGLESIGDFIGGDYLEGDYIGGQGGQFIRGCEDRIVMPCDSEEFIMADTGGPGVCDLHHCGSSFCTAGESPCRIESSTTPFNIRVQFGPGTRDESPDDNLGMCLKYEQQRCTL